AAGHAAPLAMMATCCSVRVSIVRAAYPPETAIGAATDSFAIYHATGWSPFCAPCRLTVKKNGRPPNRCQPFVL
ncbi:MAG TPA: hypothetical protein VHZ52_01615, partial [Acidobacteriaceae bacterium]|nr:hypothetical protein [Acidobacteriaceae bacterium]